MQKFLSGLIIAFFAVFVFSDIEVAAGQNASITMRINGSTIDFTSGKMPFSVADLSVRSGWVYYEYIEGTVHHYKIGTDGSEKQELS